MTKLSHKKYCQCVSCGDEMRGIYSYSIRHVCTPCGGKARIERESESKDLKKKGQAK